MRELRLPVAIELLEDGRFLAVCDEIQGCHAEGDSLEDALLNIEDAARVLLELREEVGLSLPPGFEGFASLPLKATLRDS